MVTPQSIWKTPQKILVVLAHPDDPEFFCGATLACWARQGHQIQYCLLTRGDKGSSNPEQNPEELAVIREQEQHNAARIIGVQNVQFMCYPDGFLFDYPELRKEISRLIRKEKPDILITSDPTNYFPNNDASINHPDHRAAGELVIRAYFPAAGSPMYYPELLKEGLLPHSVKEVWFSLTSQPNTIFDITETWPVKIAALHEHASQIGDLTAFDERMRSRRTPESTDEFPRYEEKFRRIVYVR